MADYPTPNFSIDLTGQVALVTGTTAGLGKRFATVLASCGARVILTGRRVDFHQRAVGEAALEHGARSGTEAHAHAGLEHHEGGDDAGAH